MGSYVYIDIINFILVFLLIDYSNGIHNNYLGNKLKSGVLVVSVLFTLALAVSVMASFFVVTKILLLIVIALIVLVILFAKIHTKRLSQYTNVECGKEDFFAKQKVMVFVPHEDDDINLMGGVIEQYVKYGSEIYIVFATNGDGDKRYDMSKMGYIRINEAIKSLSLLGVPEKNIIFLGYGDGWGEVGPHIYNANPDEILTSTSGRVSTFATKDHPAFREDKSYTCSNYYDDIKQVILEYMPDVIFCIDYDTHNDHRALSMLFEKAVGEILKTTDYKPIIYKGYGYRTAWGAPQDFYDCINILSTVNHCSDNDVVIFDWNERVRIPIDVGSIDRNLKYAKLYSALSLYASQHANECSSSIINGDKVFWHRRTDSLLYNAEISVSSGDKTKLTDFMLLDCDDLMQHGERPFDGVWHPDEDDDKKSICVTLDKKMYIDNIVLYDNPSPVDNILNAVITLDDGTIIETGKLNLHGEATIISINKQFQSFCIRIDKYEGDKFGFSEIEAYCSPSQETHRFYKLIDAQDDFVYDYIVPQNGKQVLKIYSNCGKITDVHDFSLRCDNKKCKLVLCDDEIIVYVKVGQKCRIELLSKDNTVLERIILRNPYRIERYWLINSLKCIDTRSYFNRVFKVVKHMLHE